MLSFLLPERCIHCGQPTQYSSSEHNRDLPLSHYLCEVCCRIIERQEQPPERDIRDQFERNAPNLPIEQCAAAYTFVAESPVQSVVHAFKYLGMPRLAIFLGQSIGRLIPNRFDFIISVPLHRTRFAERGYNQAEMLAKGLAGERRLVSQAIKRVRPTPSQTNLSIPERIENVRGAFALTRHSAQLKGKHILIVDDVMTTGSTLASVAETAIEAKPATISILTLALAGKSN
ncbi:MAG TPA: phosphoribosyltransferase family protein [Candidatus Kapabacteria bacterium]|jgi:ComF family protein|nr:phosphoribosyltransferase family protein [Candidatus Kapabacteria bacterium]